MTAGERVFLDTNILLAATDESRRSHRAARALFTAARQGGWHPCVSGQILREYLVVATRAVQDNGLGLSAEAAASNASAFARRAVFCEEDEVVSLRLRLLVASGGRAGKRIHDANVAATLLAHGVSTLVTENAADFRGYPEIRVIGPEALARPGPEPG